MDFSIEDTNRIKSIERTRVRLNSLPVYVVGCIVTNSTLLLTVDGVSVDTEDDCSVAVEYMPKLLLLLSRCCSCHVEI